MKDVFDMNGEEIERLYRSSSVSDICDKYHIGKNSFYSLLDKFEVVRKRGRYNTG